MNLKGCLMKRLYLLVLFSLLVFSWADEVTVLIPKGSTAKNIASILQKENLIRNALLFRIKVKLQKKMPVFYSGLMSLDQHSVTSSIIEQLQDKNRIVYIKITIPEGYNLFQIDKLLAEKNLTSPNQFYEYSTNQKNIDVLISDIPLLNNKNIGSLEGLVFPDTYFFDYYTTLPQIVKTFIDNYKRKTQQYSTFSYEKLILASIVESEAKADEERRIIASVYINRRKRKMAFGSCPTISYSRYTKGLPFKEKLYLNDLKIDSPYNTYIHSGLPPTPICNPGIKSILAILNPAKTNYLYFVSKGNGTHHFSSTAAEHNIWQNKLQNQ